jgi:NADH-quinone oxidoreductase subunit G
MIAVHPHLARIGQIERGAADDAISRLAALGGDIGSAPFVGAVRDFYLTNPIARASRIMAEMSALRAGPIAVAAE